MTICVVYTHSKEKNKLKPVDQWRAANMARLFSDADTKLTHVEFEDNEITPERLDKEAWRLRTYDVVFSSYYQNPSVFSFMMAQWQHDGTPFVIDIDDNLHDINKLNPYLLHVDEQEQENLKRLIDLAPVLTTTNQQLKEHLDKRRKPHQKVFVVPNYISIDKYGEHTPDNKDKVVIGYWGGSSHWSDIHETGMLKAVERLTKKYPHVHFLSVGMPYDGEKIPRRQRKFKDGMSGNDWYPLFESLNIDIAVGPLANEKFVEYKSNIKWQESALMGAAFVASNRGPYGRTIKDGVDGLLVNNTKGAWERALDNLIQDTTKRKQIAGNALKRVKKDHVLENNMDKVKKQYEVALQAAIDYDIGVHFDS